MSTDNRDWIREGAKVAVLFTGRMSTGVRIDTIARLTATQIILADRGRFRRDTLRAVGEASQTWSTEHSELRRTDDPDVIDARAAIRVRNLEAAIGPRLKGVKTLAEALDVLDEVVGNIEEARRRIAALSPQTDADMDRAANIAKEH